LFLIATKPWSAVKIADDSTQFFYRHLLNKPWGVIQQADAARDCGKRQRMLLSNSIKQL
jgi:hypothetical protein